MWWIVAVVVFLLLYLLFAPFFIEIDSEKNIFRVRFHQLASGSLLIHDNSIFIQLKIIAWRKQFDLLELPSEKKKQVDKVKKKSGRKISIHKIIRVIRTFEVRKLFVTLDTGNMQTNGILYPMVFALRTISKKNLSINFFGENKLVLQIRNNAARIIWAIIKS